MKTILPIIILLGSICLYSQEPFITTWKTDNPGMSCDRCIEIPTRGGGYRYTVDWGDGSGYDTIIHTSNASHEYTVPGEYEVRILGDFPRISFYLESRDTFNALYKIIDVRQWGDIAWESMEEAFWECDSLVVSAIDAPDMSAVISTARMFRGCDKFDSDLDHWDVSTIEDMSGMFQQTAVFDGNISNWDVSNVTRMVSLFDGAIGFRGNINNWDVSSVTGLFDAFARSENDWDLSDWDVSSVTDMRGAFIRCDNFTGGGIGNWDVSKVTRMEFMFRNCSSFNADLSEWDVSSCSNFGVMFEGCRAFNSDLSRWDVSSATNMNSMFMSCRNFTSDLSEWDVSNVTSFSNLFFGCEIFESDLSRWNTSNVTSLSSTFRSTHNFTSDLSNWDLSNVSNTKAMFLDARAFNGDVSTWDMSSVRDAEGMFELATSFNGDVSAWDVSGISNLIEMFRGASSFDQNLGTWTLSAVSDSLGRMLDGTILSVENYESTLNGWAANSLTPNNVVLENNLDYCDDSGRKILLDKGWTIRQDKQLDAAECMMTSVTENAPPSLSVFPNPTIEGLTVITQTQLYIKIIDVRGRATATHYLTTGHNDLDVSNLDDGLYVILDMYNKEIGRFVKSDN